MNYYKQVLELARTNNIDIYALHIADECEAIFGEDHPEFEKLCNALNELYLNTYHLSCETLLAALKYALEQGDVKLENMREGTEDFNLVVELACSMD